LSKIYEYHDRAWDCATGNGQAAISCAKFFSHVEATDISVEQIQHCITHHKINYSVSPAEHTPFENQSFDLVMVALAIHWFDQEKFFQEVERVLKAKGILAVWGYGRLETEHEIDETITKNLLEPIDRFWASGNGSILYVKPNQPASLYQHGTHYLAINCAIAHSRIDPYRYTSPSSSSSFSIDMICAITVKI
jgi:ubiquinone/menaquinone biosynthesis C-methylase UbiE